jgi:hypothetical protein
MHNWNAIENELAHRRLERDRAIEAEARAALAVPTRPSPRPVPLLDVASWSLKLKQLVASAVLWISSVSSCQSPTSPYATVQSRPASRTNCA